MEFDRENLKEKLDSRPTPPERQERKEALDISYISIVLQLLYLY